MKISFRLVLAALSILTGAAEIAQSAAPSALDNVRLTSDQLLDRVAIEALGIEYFYLLDHGQSEQLADLFVENGIQDNNDGKPKIGREAIRAYYAARSKGIVSRHVSTNLRLVFAEKNRVLGTRTFTRYGGEGPGIHPAMPSVAEYAEVYVRGADGRWRFESRKVTSLFSSVGSEGRPQTQGPPRAQSLGNSAP